MKTRHDPSTKPYYKCLSCSRFRHSCAGIPTRDMDLQDWCEYMRDVKEMAHLTNAHIAKDAEVSEKTIDRIMALNHEQDIMRATARRIEIAIIGSVNTHTCYLDYDGGAMTERINRLLEEIDHLLKENKRYAQIIDKYLDVQSSEVN